MSDRNKNGQTVAGERNLFEAGLYQKGARAMIETCRDSWFEEGTRLFYIVPKQASDSILPLSIQPAPAETSRVFVGRMEIITPEIQDDVRQALARYDRASSRKVWPVPRSNCQAYRRKAWLLGLRVYVRLESGTDLQ